MEAKVIVELSKLEDIGTRQDSSEHSGKVRAHVAKIIRKLIASLGKEKSQS
ncbi:hypothetical protein [Methylobacterium nodulans]|uniref:hypothetical protein n=1 Tax=Methylobacterium nodulans TaxID=114616 RepID=UPI0012EDF3F1|nr:hypothetical protein [Methylobacterium nodulans]